MRIHPAIFCIAATLLLGSTIARADEQAEAERLAEGAIKQGTIDFLTDREFDIDEAEVTGTVEAVDPDEHVEVVIDDLQLVPNHVSLTTTIDARFEFEGAATMDGDQIDVQVTATVSTTLDVEVDYRIENGLLHLDSRVTDAEFSVTLLEAEPDELANDKEAVEQVAEEVLERVADELIFEINDFIALQNNL